MAFLPNDILNKKIHVVGMTGAEGASIARFLATEGAKDVTLHDFVEIGDLRESFNRFHEALTEQEQNEQFEELMSLPFEARIGPDAYLDGVEDAELLFLPQSWFRYEQNKVLHDLKGKIPFWNITKLYVELAPCKVVGISGTSGKSTTSRLLFEICKKDRTTWFTGNDRLNVQVLDKLPEMKPEDVLVIEVSNRQLLFDFDKPFDIAGLTHVMPSHLDDHKNAAAYIEAKKRLFRGQTSEQHAVLNADDEISERFLPEITAVQGLFSLEKELEAGAFLKNGELWIRWNGKGYRLAAERDLKMPGPHNAANILLASLIAFLLDVDTKTIRETITSFSGIPHRLEVVREVRGVTYVEDSSACNPDGPRFAVQSFHQPVTLLVGGKRPKPEEGEFLPMFRSIVKARMRGLVIYGAIREQMQSELDQVKAELQVEDFPVEHAETMPEAFAKGVAMSRSGDVLILSPGCESFGEFSEYRERAQVFHDLVNAL